MTEQPKKKYEEGCILVGQKPFIKYLDASTMQLEKVDELTIKARGAFTAKAIDLSEVLKKKYDMEIKELKTGSSEFTNKEGREVRVSTIDIILVKT